MLKRFCAYFCKPRWGYALGAFICAALLAFALYLQYQDDQEPCPLCIFQRVAYVGLLMVFVIAAIHAAARRAWLYFYSGLLSLIALAGISVAGRQVWLQHLPADLVPACGPGLNYMIKKFPLSKVLEKVFTGSGECAEVGWMFLHLSIAEWSLIWFVLLLILAIVIAVKRKN